MMWHLFAMRLVLALLLGAFIGAERQWRQRMAGLRTNTLVVLMSSGHQNSLLENGVNRFSLECGVSAVSWEIMTESE